MPTIVTGLSADQVGVLSLLNATWPAGTRVNLADAGVSVPSQHPLLGEISAFVQSSVASLPYYTKDRVIWLTAAPTAEALYGAIQDLRAWLIPSFGWEDPNCPIVTPGQSNAVLSQVLARISPAGYFRWWTTLPLLRIVLAKLSMIRQLDKRRPVCSYERTPSLYELRRQFTAAIAAGNYQAAVDAIDTLDRHQLDTAANSVFMRIILRDRFGEYADIVADDETKRILTLRIPLRVRMAIFRAYYNQFLATYEQQGDLASATAAYAQKVHTEIAGLLAASSPEHGVDARRLLAYWAVTVEDADVARDLLLRQPEIGVCSLLEGIVSTARAGDLRQRVQEAYERQDWRRVQTLGLELLKQTTEHLALLEESLVHHPNPVISRQVAAQRPADRGPAEERPSTWTPPEPSVPANWLDWLKCLRDDRLQMALAFLDDTEHPPTEKIDGATLAELQTAIEEFYTAPSFISDSRVGHVAQAGLAELIEEIIKEPSFPRTTWLAFYLVLMETWGGLRAGSLLQAEWHLLLRLATVALDADPRHESRVLAQVQSWWHARPVGAMIPFAIEAIDLLAEHVLDRPAVIVFFYDTMRVAIENRGFVSAGQLALLHRLGQQLQITSAELAPLQVDKEDEPVVDPIRDAQLNKIAIVTSGGASAARSAAELIRQRTDADVVVVEADAASTATRSAGDADAILFIWRRSSHALYRAFQGRCRERLVYVGGTGASSIVLALEAWAEKYRPAFQCQA